jgi:hypothetical protein
VPEQPRCCERVWRACADRTAGIGYLCGFFGGSLCTSSGHRSSINWRIGSEIASIRRRTTLAKQREHPAAVTRNSPRLIPLLHDQPRALFLADVELLCGGGFGRLAIRRLDEPEELDAIP